MNDHYKEWKNVLDFKSALVLQRKEDLSEMDVAFVEGAITSKEQEEKLRKIRSLAKKLVAIGSCACSGLPAGQRNEFTPEKNAEIQAILTRFSYAAKVQKIADLVPIDSQVSGCPMNEAAFLDILNLYLKEFGVTS